MAAATSAVTSLPTRERELKPRLLGVRNAHAVSLPTRERELKLKDGEKARHAIESLPTRERELKHGFRVAIGATVGRSLHGSVN